MRIRVKSVWNLISGGRREGGTDFVKETLVVKKMYYWCDSNCLIKNWEQKKSQKGKEKKKFSMTGSTTNWVTT